jgi:hypothetical protein
MTRHSLQALPRTWGDCQSQGLGTPERPCAHLRCRWNLQIDINPQSGEMRLLDNGPEHTCALRVAQHDGLQLDEIAAIMGISIERVRQLEAKALHKLRQLTTTGSSTESDRVDLEHETIARLARTVTPFIGG